MFAVIAVNVEMCFRTVKVETLKTVLSVLFLLTHDQPVTKQDIKTDFDTVGPTASDLVDIRKKWVHVLKRSKRTMAAKTSVAEELLDALKMPKLHAIQVRTRLCLRYQ